MGEDLVVVGLGRVGFWESRVAGLRPFCWASSTLRCGKDGQRSLPVAMPPPSALPVLW